MKKTLLIFNFCCLFIHFCSGQNIDFSNSDTSLKVNDVKQAKILVIKIDTLLFQGVPENKIKIRVGNQGLLNLGDDFDTTQIVRLSSYPNLINEIVLSNDSSIIEIPVDKKGSHISLKNAYNYKRDTLIINKLMIFETKTLDSTFSIVSYVKIINNNLDDKAYKVDIKRSGTDYVSPPLTLEVTIDELSYKTKLNLSNSGMVEITHGHGHKPHKYFKKNLEYKKHVKYIIFEKTTEVYNWIGEIFLNDERK